MKGRIMSKKVSAKKSVSAVQRPDPRFAQETELAPPTDAEILACGVVNGDSQERVADFRRRTAV